MLFDTLSSSFARTHATNATDSGFPSRVPTVTEPSGDGVIDLCKLETGLAQNLLLLVPYGVASDNHTFDLRVIGWRKLPVRAAVAQTLTPVWVPHLLYQFAFTHGGIVGVANSTVLATERFCDTVTKTYGPDGGCTLYTNAADLIAGVLVDVIGNQKVEVTFDLGSGTSLNCLWAGL
jgi:hypothetical protein